MLVGICGQSGSGKDTVADRLIKNHGFVKVAFADPMKRFVQDVFDFTDEQIWGASEHRNATDHRYLRKEGVIENWSDAYLTPRFALQTLGTEWGRNCYPDVWVEYAIRIHKRLQEGGYAYDQKRGLFTVSMLMNAETTKDGYPPAMWPKTHVVISDVRFKNEVAGIKRAGGHIFKVERPGYEGKVGVAGHASEEEQKSIPDSEFSVIIKNNSTLENLYTTVDTAMKLVKGK